MKKYDFVFCKQAKNSPKQQGKHIRYVNNVNAFWEKDKNLFK